MLPSVLVRIMSYEKWSMLLEQQKDHKRRKKEDKEKAGIAVCKTEEETSAFHDSEADVVGLH